MALYVCNVVIECVIVYVCRIIQQKSQLVLYEPCFYRASNGPNLILPSFERTGLSFIERRTDGPFFRVGFYTNICDFF